LYLPRLLDIDQRYGAAGLTASAGLAGWVEFALLRRGLSKRIGDAHLPRGLLARLWFAAVLGSALAWAVKVLLPPVHPVLRATLVLGMFGTAYLATSLALGVAEAHSAVRRVRRLFRR
jgi:putative peptidoglycan lipid II flippase